MRKSKQKIINEILRLTRVLTQCKYGSEDDKQIKKLIQENLVMLSELDSLSAERRRRKQDETFRANLAACV